MCRKRQRLSKLEKAQVLSSFPLNSKEFRNFDDLLVATVNHSFVEKTSHTMAQPMEHKHIYDEFMSKWDEALPAAIQDMKANGKFAGENISGLKLAPVDIFDTGKLFFFDVTNNRINLCNLQGQEALLKKMMKWHKKDMSFENQPSVSDSTWMELGVRLLSAAVQLPVVKARKRTESGPITIQFVIEYKGAEGTTPLLLLFEGEANKKRGPMEQVQEQQNAQLPPTATGKPDPNLPDPDIYKRPQEEIDQLKEKSKTKEKPRFPGTKAESDKTEFLLYFPNSEPVYERMNQLEKAHGKDFEDPNVAQKIITDLVQGGFILMKDVLPSLFAAGVFITWLHSFKLENLEAKMKENLEAQPKDKPNRTGPDRYIATIQGFAATNMALLLHFVIHKYQEKTGLTNVHRDLGFGRIPTGKEAKAWQNVVSHLWDLKQELLDRIAALTLFCFRAAERSNVIFAKRDEFTYTKILGKSSLVALEFRSNLTNSGAYIATECQGNNGKRRYFLNHWLRALFFTHLPGIETLIGRKSIKDQQDMLLGYTEFHVEAIEMAENYNLYKIYKDNGKDINMFQYDGKDDSKYLYFPVPKFEGWKNCNLWLGDSSKRPKHFEAMVAAEEEKDNAEKESAEKESDDKKKESDDKKEEADEEEEETVPAAKVVEEESETHEEEGKDDAVNAMVVEDEDNNEQA